MKKMHIGICKHCDTKKPVNDEDVCFGCFVKELNGEIA